MRPAQIRTLISRVGGKRKLAGLVGVSTRTVEGWLGDRRPSRLAVLSLRRLAK